jgi:hypothetical protein
MGKRIRNCSLTLVLILFFLISIWGQFENGFQSYNHDLKSKKIPVLQTQVQYLTSGHFISSVSENMESEFLQMSLFVFLTTFLLQKGSAESKKPDEEKTASDFVSDQNENEFSKQQRRRHPFLWRLYENSLTLSLLALFLFFFFAHAYGSLEMINQGRLVEGEPALGFWQVFRETEFWFESFQNWQSEFFSIAIMGLLSIFLRQKGSPQSKKLTDPHWKTGGD